MNKVIFVDWGVLLHRAIFAWRLRKNIPATYTGLSMLFACLKRLTLSPDDIVIIAVDSEKGSWRKSLDVQYKANRKEKREAHVDINWKYWFGEFDNLLNNLSYSTPFFIIKIDKIESDDIIAIGVKKFNNRECVVVSSDTDFEQLTIFSNVKLFSPISKKFKVVSNPYGTLLKKIEKETTDNLISPILSEQDYEIRKKIVSLLELPQEIENKVSLELDKLQEKEFDLEQLLFPSLMNRFMEIYNPTKKQEEEVLNG